MRPTLKDRFFWLVSIRLICFKEKDAIKKNKIVNMDSLLGIWEFSIFSPVYAYQTMKEFISDDEFKSVYFSFTPLKNIKLWRVK